MTIQLKKFGVTLTSRPNGKESYNAYLPELRNVTPEEIIVIDFDGVNTFSPSWADEFITPIQKEFNDKLILKNTANLSVKATIELLEQINEIKFKWE
ncbi:MAG: DUF4325 domain-containing protein [Patescibacteria group bacterium]